MKPINAIRMGGADVLPLVEGGKGVSATNGQSSGAWAHAGGVGTVSAVNADSYDADGKVIPQIYHAKTRRERHEELVAYGIAGGIAQVKVAHEVNGGRGRIHANILWEMGGAERIIRGMLEAVPGMIHGVTCGAGMPYGLAAVAREHHVYMYPIVSSARAFNALWRRAYSKASEWLGGVVYEDPWLAGGHNGLSNSENPRQPEDPFPRVLALRQLMNSFGLQAVPIIMAGGVWWLEEWEDWIDNPDLGPIAFQFGTRPLLTKESPIPDEWKQRLLTLKPGDVSLQAFSPTGFYSSAVRTRLLRDLEERSERQVAYIGAAEGDKTAEYGVGPRKRPVWMTPEDRAKVELWTRQGFTEALRTPDDTLVFETPEAAREILQDQTDCMGCLSHCRFSNWTQIEPDFSTGKRADPRSFCIQKKLQAIAHGGGTEDNLMFAGQVATRFAQDPFYSNGFIPTAGQLVERILTGR
ncbi:NAD(P)H-dependent flavin oxidoreductase [Humitalea sp. 24SJ18S-53]|uniref:NAD(P)H-dependent flavin oxidoreductase n=1 Tax=Humitalea sp. 24SJ18S-53 TaxID=3422307 RepID=UPI003D66C8E5